jgi:glycosyltransferase involved in cell wall biosynthesis
MRNQKIATILIPNYKTPTLTKICLRLIRKYTDLSSVEVIVIDNDSKDESTKYLKSLKWIKLIERKGIKGEGGPMSHAKALDLGLRMVKTNYVISFHTDTFVKDKNWLKILLDPFKEKNNLAAVGSWKLENKKILNNIGKKFEYLFKLLIGQEINKERFDKNYHYLRSHCAVYKTHIVKKLKTNFSDGEESPGKVMHKKIIAAGYNVVFLESKFLSKYMDHVNHATAAINSHLNKRTTNKFYKKFTQLTNKKEIKQILEDKSLDS